MEEVNQSGRFACECRHSIRSMATDGLGTAFKWEIFSCSCSGLRWAVLQAVRPQNCCGHLMGKGEGRREGRGGDGHSAWDLVSPLEAKW